MKNKTNKILILGAIIIILIAVVYSSKKVNTVIAPESPVVMVDTIKGCYVSTLAKDVYTLAITDINDENVQGKLAYKNFEKDSSSGTFNGTFSNNILLGNYSFNSEGMSSNREVIFKKVGENFVQGFGPVISKDDKEIFEDISKITYDSNLIFVKSTCK